MGEVFLGRPRQQTLANSAWKRHRATTTVIHTFLTDFEEANAVTSRNKCRGLWDIDSKLTSSLLTPMWGLRKLQGGFGEGHKPSQTACGSVIGHLNRHPNCLYTLHGNKCQENGMCARSIVNYMLLWPSPGPLGRRHQTHRGGWGGATHPRK